MSTHPWWMFIAGIAIGLGILVLVLWALVSAMKAAVMRGLGW